MAISNPLGKDSKHFHQYRLPCVLLALRELASELSHLFQLGRRCHAVALGHTANGDNALVLHLQYAQVDLYIAIAAS